MEQYNFPQPKSQGEQLKDIISKDTYNKFCVDCNQRDAEWANISYGTFLCGDCANVHKSVFG